MDDAVTDRSPAAKLRRQLAAARASGESFESVWPAALNLALRGAKTDRGQWAEALCWAAGEWRAAYNGEPAGISAAAIAELVESADA